MLGQRVLSSAIILPLAVILIWVGDPWYSLAIGLLSLLAVIEFYRMIAHGEYFPLVSWGVVITLLFVLNGYLIAHHQMDFTAPVLTATVAFSLIGVLFQSRIQLALVNWALTMAGIFYIGWFLSYFILLRNLDNGTAWAYLAILGTFACDSTAYLVGRAWGKRKLAPQISPFKSWEGTIAGLLAAVGIVLILAYVFRLTPGPTRLELGFLQAIALGILIGVFAPLGDLAESMLKRSAGVKDTGSLIPGHGGLLDRMDSLLFAVIGVFYYSQWVMPWWQRTF